MVLYTNNPCDKNLIEVYREKLNNAISEGSDYDIILELSQQLDDLIVNYYKASPSDIRL